MVFRKFKDSLGLIYIFKCIYPILAFPATHIFARHNDGAALLDDAPLHHHAHHDGVPGIEDVLREDAQLAWEDCNVLVLLLISLFDLLAVRHEAVEEVVNDIGLEDADVLTVCHLLSIALDLDVEGQDDSIP